jgi:hypothetical protein
MRIQMKMREENMDTEEAISSEDDFEEEVEDRMKFFPWER